MIRKGTKFIGQDKTKIAFAIDEKLAELRTMKRTDDSSMFPLRDNIFLWHENLTAEEICNIIIFDNDWKNNPRPKGSTSKMTSLTQINVLVIRDLGEEDQKNRGLIEDFIQRRTIHEKHDKFAKPREHCTLISTKSIGDLQNLYSSNTMYNLNVLCEESKIIR